MVEFIWRINMPEWIWIPIGISSALVTLVIGFVLYQIFGVRRLADTKVRANRIIKDAEKEADRIIKEAEVEGKDRWFKQKENLEKETSTMRKDIEKQAKKVSEREAMLERRSHYLTERESTLIRNEKYLANLERLLKTKMERYDQLIEEENKRLEKTALISKQKAKKELLKNLRKQVDLEALQMVKDIKERARTEAERTAKEIISQAIQKVSLSHWTESTVSVVELPTDELKGRIIGREGRNIRTFETLSGVEVLVDDTPGAVIISAFDPIRREKAKLTLERLISDGRIHPARIEEVFQEVEKELLVHIKELGEEAAAELGILGLHSELFNYIGRMKYRSSYGQNLLQHSREVAHLCLQMACELKLDPQTAARAGLLHDIGKVAETSMEGPHAEIGARIAAQYGEDETVVNAIAAHHEEVPMENPYSFLVATADAISGSRPGARRETLEAYLKRLERLENIAVSFEGVEKAYAIQAGREVRVLVQPDIISDLEVEEMGSKIVHQIQNELKYPGYIKVVVIREVRNVEYAK
ncbi:ribonuclease Y [candidate division WOR-3 bacterium]|uniref:Ribonuclease Y n=1 Tax=candidate division WOR-3 bacterium TaxID=2052148 RepID=A0A9D5K8P9_UNCW3|nr:ribonuclease Y [candidate division WOR-3 bacterium]MBD3364388.1 ribonuclease Y [candidate division WOR-3 bacterium]